jgi:hypothetical protein
MRSFISKPINQAELLALIKELFQEIKQLFYKVDKKKHNFLFYEHFTIYI